MEQYIPLIKRTAKSLYWKQYELARNIGLTLGDYESLATVGFLKGMRNFRPERRTSVHKYAFNYMRQEIRETINKMLKDRNKTASLSAMLPSSGKSPWPKRSECMTLGGITRAFRSSLTDGEVKILNLSYYDNQSPYKIAKKLGISPKIAEARLRSAHRKIKDGILEFGPISDKNGKMMDDIEVNLIRASIKAIEREQLAAARKRHGDEG